MLSNATQRIGSRIGEAPLPGAGSPLRDADEEAVRRKFSENLRALCSRHKSISKVCRDLGINRQQFNKYLSGVSFPSAYNFDRICRYFEIERSIMLGDTGRQAGGEGAGVSPAALLFGPTLKQMQGANPDASRKLERYVGYYHSYYCSPAYPGQILKSVSHIYGKDGLFFDKTLERAVDRSGGKVGTGIVNRYSGAVIHTDDRVYILHQTMVLHQTLSMVAFYPSYSATPRLLSGVFVSVSSGPARQPFAARTVYEFHGRSPDLRKMVTACGLYPVGSRAISDDITRRLNNHVDADETVLRALEY